MSDHQVLPLKICDEIYQCFLSVADDEKLARALLLVFIRRFGGLQLYVPKRIRLMDWKQDIRQRYNGSNAREICRLYGWSFRYGKRLIHTVVHHPAFEEEPPSFHQDSAPLSAGEAAYVNQMRYDYSVYPSDMEPFGKKRQT